MAEETADRDPVPMTREGTGVSIDARPARLVSQLASGPGREVTAHTADGAALREPLPDGLRQVTFRLSDDVRVEATPAAELVAVAGDGGRVVVLSLGGEVTVVPATNGDRFALAPREALVVPAGGAAPRVVDTGAMAAGDDAEVAAVLDAA